MLQANSPPHQMIIFNLTLIKSRSSQPQRRREIWHDRSACIIILLLFWNILVKIFCIMSSYNDPIHHSAIRSSPSSDNIYQYQPLPGPRVTRHHGIPSLNVISSLISTSLATGCRPQHGCIFINGNSDETEILSLLTMLSSVICNKCSSFFFNV